MMEQNYLPYGGQEAQGREKEGWGKRGKKRDRERELGTKYTLQSYAPTGLLYPIKLHLLNFYSSQ
jgi:hypothetical protein